MYLKTPLDLEEALNQAPSAAIILNRSDENGQDSALLMSQVLDKVLDLPTHSFSALVGFFGHRGGGNQGDRTLADIILDEANRSIAGSQSFEDSAFRLAIGVNSSAAAQHASRAWYWLCRYRHEAFNGKEKTDALRQAFLKEAQDNGFKAASQRLLIPLAPEKQAADGYEASPFTLDALRFTEQLRPRSGDEFNETLPQLEEWFKATLLEPYRQSPFSDDTKILLGFLLQRRSDVRISPKQTQNGVTTVFHPKMYVVEQKEEARTISIVGSHNWTQSALGLLQEDTVLSNVEVATLHVDPGMLWGAVRNGLPPSNESLGRRVCGTAHLLFQQSRYILGSWQADAKDRLLPAWELEPATKKIANFTPPPAVSEPDSSYGGTRQYSPAFIRLAPHLQKLAERLIGMGNLDSSVLKKYRDFFEDEDALPFGYTPATYQADAALRLNAILGPSPLVASESSDRTRGAFLTDETGLGKTIVGQMVATTLLVERLKERARLPSSVPHYLYASFIVPARLTGDQKQESGWIGHRIDVERAIRSLLSNVDRHGKSIDDLMSLLKMRVFSIGAFSRSLFDADDIGTYGPAEEHSFDELTVNKQVAADFYHVARSEVILVDESHNFRNEQSRRTRTFRFLASLPLPGEEWMFETGSSDEKPNSQPLPVARRLLFLSATPFNNDVSDLTTQMGHFDQYQDWTQAYPAKQEFPTVLKEALNFWRTASIHTPEEPKDKLREHFDTLLRYVARHFESGRSLSEREDKIAARNGSSRRSTTDFGPRYEWRADSYVDTLKVVQEWSSRRANDPDTQRPLTPNEERARQEAQERMDALLVQMFVQRSRARVLRMTQAAGEDEMNSMFRKPRIPRYPVALNEGPEQADEREASSDFEREVLASLYRLLGKSDEESDNEADLLSFQSYKIAVQRSSSSGDGSTKPNFLGFQLTGLVKRLQSSPYAFLRTIVRGVLRHALTELALVEHLIGQLQAGTLDLPDEHFLVAKAPRLENALADARSKVEKKSVAFLASVMGGVEPDESSTFFQDLTGCNKQAAAHEPSRVKDFEKALRKTHEFIINGQLELNGLEQNHWVRVLILDVCKIPEEVEGASLLWQDACTVLKWLEKEGNDQQGLKDRLYKKLDEDGTSYALGAVRQRCVALVQNAPASFQQEARIYRRFALWAKNRLDDDPRLRSLVAWLLIQAQARQESGKSGAPTEELLRCGVRSLVFTEYTDTQEYLLSVIAALGATYRPYVSDYNEVPEANQCRRTLQDTVRHLTRELADEVSRIGRRLHQWTMVVQEQASDDERHFTFAKPRLYEDPICREDGTLPDWLAQLTSSDNAVMADAVWNMCSHLGRICSGNNHTDTAHHLFPDAGSQAPDVIEDDDEATEEGTDPDVSSAVAEHEIIDAFSPWYQIEPRMQYRINRAHKAEKEDDLDSLREDTRRFREAAKRTVNTLVSTEVMAEGVNLQEAGVVVHYDLPWNPTRLIQRNGRVDRRINPYYEEPEHRTDLINNMVASVNEANTQRKANISFEREDVPDFHKPAQIYHMTVVPPEPKLDDVDDDTLVRRVRQRIFLKLETIRMLFGLSTWPVVLDRDAARKVLSGELDYETPGFRRREDLFAVWSQLQEVTTAHPEAEEPEPTSFFLEVDPSFAEQLADAVAGTEHKDPDAVRKHWRARLRGTGLVQSSQYIKDTTVVRSITDISKLKDESKGFINGLLFCQKNAEAPICNQMTYWSTPSDMHNKGQQRFQLMMAECVEKDRLRLSVCDLSELSATEETTSGYTNLPSSPAALAEDIFIELVNYLAHPKSRGIEAVESSSASIEEETKLKERFSTIAQVDKTMKWLTKTGNGKPGQRKYRSGPDPEQEPTQASNFWITVKP